MQYIFGLKVQAVLQQKEHNNTNTARAEARKNHSHGHKLLLGSCIGDNSVFLAEANRKRSKRVYFFLTTYKREFTCKLGIPYKQHIAALFQLTKILNERAIHGHMIISNSRWIEAMVNPEEVFLLQKPKKIFCFHEREAQKLYKNLAHTSKRCICEMIFMFLLGYCAVTWMNILHFDWYTDFLLLP
ncbi:hypothetical protein ACJX0J_025637 [Zea mays]